MSFFADARAVSVSVFSVDLFSVSAVFTALSCAESAWNSSNSVWESPSELDVSAMRVAKSDTIDSSMPRGPPDSMPL